MKLSGVLRYYPTKKVTTGSPLPAATSSERYQYLPFQRTSGIYLLVVALLSHFPFSVGAVAADTFFPEFAQSLMGLPLQTLGWIECLLGLLERNPISLWLLGFLLHPFHIEAFFIQVD